MSCPKDSASWVDAQLAWTVVCVFIKTNRKALDRRKREEFEMHYSINPNCEFIDTELKQEIGFEEYRIAP